MPSTRGQPHAPRLPQTSVGADSISARFAAVQTPTGGMNPAPTAHGERPADRGGRSHPGKRSAGCPHPAGPCGGAHPNSPLVKRGREWRSRDCFAANFRFFKRQPAAGQSLRHGLRPCHLPLTREAKWSRTPRPTACPTAAATPVGADSISARFAAAQTPAGGMNPAPAAHGERPANRNSRSYPGKRRAGCPHPAGPCGGASPPANCGKTAGTLQNKQLQRARLGI